ncbi:hypothetical protein GZ989_011310 (plasmid) [Campylobacter fetus]|uniref:Uncharacterized protein n=1 Tax=Campylobacter fetus TaxID=196 RepID=A0A974MV59_CAMFE|nr:hypothetical protein [Campylobacter fetus]OCS32892.1 hypothetical protein AWR31_08105 [Campylobacter fetus subsp. venerealis]QMS59894.1 hypothetical protein GZ989_011310 [Campylobacter fetus]
MTNENTQNTQTTQKLYVSAGSFTKDDGISRTVTGFGEMKPYVDDKGQTQDVNARAALKKISDIGNFLSATVGVKDKNKIGIDIKGTDEKGQETFMKANVWTDSGIGKSGQRYSFHKITIEVSPDKVNKETGEVLQPAQKLYATKSLKGGYSFDANNNNELIAKFNASIQKGAEFTLTPKKDSTLEKYPELANTISIIKEQKSSYVEIGFVTGKGATINSITPTNSGNEIGASQLQNSVTKAKAKKIKDVER